MSCIADEFAARNPRKRDRNSDTVATLCEVYYTVLVFDRVVVVSSSFWATTWKITPVGQFNYALYRQTGSKKERQIGGKSERKREIETVGFRRIRMRSKKDSASPLGRCPKHINI